MDKLRAVRDVADQPAEVLLVLVARLPFVLARFVTPGYDEILGGKGPGPNAISHASSCPC